MKKGELAHVCPTNHNINIKQEQCTRVFRNAQDKINDLMIMVIHLTLIDNDSYTTDFD